MMSQWIYVVFHLTEIRLCAIQEADIGNQVHKGYSAVCEAKHMSQFGRISYMVKVEFCYAFEMCNNAIEYMVDTITT